jgi:hypothetical protein
MRTLLTLLALSIFGCQSAPAAKKDAPVVSAADPVKAGEVLLSLERGACYGRCPIYRVEVLADGLVRFKGERNVRVTEPVEAKLDAAALGALTSRLEQSGFSSWSDFTAVTETDQATVVITFKGKTVRHYLGDGKAPEALTLLERDLDALIGTARWVTGAGADTL